MDTYWQRSLLDSLSVNYRLFAREQKTKQMIRKLKERNQWQKKEHFEVSRMKSDAGRKCSTLDSFHLLSPVSLIIYVKQ